VLKKKAGLAPAFAAFFHCCGAGTCFVHLSFRMKSAFASVAWTGRSVQGAAETTEKKCLISQSLAAAPAG
jgi:hypothetical protein